MQQADDDMGLTDRGKDWRTRLCAPSCRRMLGSDVFQDFVMCLEQGLANFSSKNHVVHILGFVGPYEVTVFFV